MEAHIDDSRLRSFVVSWLASLSRAEMSDARTAKSCACRSRSPPSFHR
jgi:hypothetical protein